jgi:hypothetical protein
MPHLAPPPEPIAEDGGKSKISGCLLGNRRNAATVAFQPATPEVAFRVAVLALYPYDRFSVEAVARRVKSDRLRRVEG